MPPNTSIVFKNLSIGVEDKPNSSFKVAIYWDQDGTGINMTKIHQIYTRNKSCVAVLDNQQFTSANHSRVVVRRHIFGDLGERATYVQWIADLG
jgi:hypothetical protein